MFRKIHIHCKCYANRILFLYLCNASLLENLFQFSFNLDAKYKSTLVKYWKILKMSELPSKRLIQLLNKNDLI